ncbi:MAG: hypothetical protein AAF517_05895 [Planctomycetota bacterium]
MKRLREILWRPILPRPARWQRTTLYLLFAWYLLALVWLEQDRYRPSCSLNVSELVVQATYLPALPWGYLIHHVHDFRRPMGRFEAYVCVYLIIGSSLFSWYLLFRFVDFARDRIRPRSFSSTSRRRETQ